MKSNGIIEISGRNNPKIDTHIDICCFLIILVLRRVAGDPSAAGEAAEVKSNDISEISDPNNHKINTHADISVLSFEFWCDGGRRVSLDRRMGRRT